MWYKCLNTTRGTAAVHYYDPVARLWLWGSNPYYISANVGIPVLYNNSRIYPSGFTYNGYDYYLLESGKVLWYNTSLGWVITPCVGFNYKEYSETSDTGVVSWLGDTWWSCATLAGTYIPRGKDKTTRQNITIAMSTPIGWTCATMFGEYVRTTTPPSGSVIKKTVGLATYTTGWTTVENEENTVHTGLFTSTTSLLNNKPIFSGCDGKYCWYDGTKWIISFLSGIKDISVGYWERATIEGVYTRRFTANTPPVTDPVTLPDEPPQPTTYTLTFAQYILGTNTADIYMAQEAVWL